jgi:hypothetical protein
MTTARMTCVWTGPEQLEELFRDSHVVRSGGGLTLSDHCVIADENGDAVEEFMGYADTAFEEITDTTWVRKTFEIDDPKIANATLCIAGQKLRGSGKLAGTFNGKPFAARAKANCKPWYSDWVLVPLPAKVREGTNELILHTTGSLVWRLFIVPSVLPNRSAKSIDSGVNWDDEHLGKGGFIDGEYVTRISGKRIAARGIITSPPLQIKKGQITLFRDAALCRSSGSRPGGIELSVPSLSVASAGRVTELSISTNCKAAVEVRLGTGPWLDAPSAWTPWSPLTKTVARKLERQLPEPGPRFVQFRITLERGRAAPRHQTVPALKQIKLNAALKPSVAGELPQIEVDGPATVLPGRPFAHQRCSERLRFFREKFKLDRVFSAGADEWDSLLRLAAWVGDYCSNRVHGVGLIPKIVYETQMILELGHEKRASVHCGGLAFALVQLAAAFGLTGRVLLRGNHLVTEFWSPVHRKWAVVDPMDQLPDPKTGKITEWTGGFGGYYCRADGLPMSAIELGRARGKITRRHYVSGSGKYEERDASVPRDLRWFRREISYPERNNYTDAAEPLFRADVFRYSGHLKVRRRGAAAMPWCSHFTSRCGDVEWTVGETSVFLTAMPNGRVLAQLRSQLPNTADFVVNGAELGSDAYEWDLNKTNRLAVHAVNTLGQAGPATICVIGS